MLSVEDDVKKQIIQIINTLIMLLLVSAGLMQIVEKEELEKQILLVADPYTRDLLLMRTQYHHYIYFIVVTISTVGYGDIIPFTVYGKIIVMGLVCVVIVIIPKQTNDLVQLLGSQSEYAKRRYKASTDISHIIITGNITLEALKSFCQELFHEDHGNQYKHAVIINNELPSREMEKFLNESENDKFLIYLEGDPMNAKDLIRADIGKAKACIIFNDKLSNDPYSSDHQNLLLGIFIKKFVYNYNIEEKSTNKNFRLCMQLIKSENKYHYFNALQSIYCKKMQPDQLITIEEIKMNLLAKSCLTPGVLALISNLVMSSSPLPLGHDKDWLKEYSEGKNHEIYRVCLPIDLYIDKSFLEIVKDIYNEKESQVIIFALEIEIDNMSVFRLNPGNLALSKVFEIHHIERYNHSNIKIYAYMICGDKGIAEGISKEEYILKKTIKPQIINTAINNYVLNKKDDKCTVNEDFTDSDSEHEDYINKNNNNNNSNTSPNLVNSDDLDINAEKFYIYKNRREYNEEYEEENLDIMQHTVKDHPIINNHIVVCGIHSAIVHFILPLRSTNIAYKDLKYIVFLAPVLTPTIYEWLTKFPKIVFIQGSPLLPENLYRANILNAEKAAILSKNYDSDLSKNDMSKNIYNESNKFDEDHNNESNNSNINNSHDRMSDAEAIFIYKAIKKCTKNIQIVTDLISTENIEYLIDKKYISAVLFRKEFLPLYEFTPLFASGEVFFPGIIDRITCQSYYNPHLLVILKKLLIGGSQMKSKKLARLEEDLKIPESDLWLIKVPESHVNESFEKLFNHFNKSNSVIAIGLYRKNILDDFYYVYTNPKKNTMIQREDLVFVLGQVSNIMDLKEEKIINRSNDNIQTDDNESLIDSLNNSSFDNSFQGLMENKKNNKNLLFKRNEKKNVTYKKEFDEKGYGPNELSSKQNKNELNKILKKKGTIVSKQVIRSDSVILQNKKSFFDLNTRENCTSTKHIEIEKLGKRINFIRDKIHILNKEYENFPNFMSKILDIEINREFNMIMNDRREE